MPKNTEGGSPRAPTMLCPSTSKAKVLPLVSEVLEPARLAQKIIPRSKMLRLLVPPILTVNRMVTECLNACLPALYSKPRPHDSLCVGANHFSEQGGVPNKLATEFIYNILISAKDRARQRNSWSL
jgi:hypothetical protein